MKIRLIFTLILIGLCGIAKACDICGCGVGSYYIGILPEYNKRFAGIRYQHKTLQTHLGPTGERTPLTTSEIYQSLEFWGGWNISKKIRMLAFIPYNFNQRQNQIEEGKKNGLGDVALMAYYNLVDQKGTLGEKLLIQSLWIGAGIKMPTGKYEPNEHLDSQDSPNNFQLGTASLDFSFNAAYDVRYHDTGININVNYKANTANNWEYVYGNKFSANILAYYKLRIANVVTVAPNIGILYETSQKDLENKSFEIGNSGGYATAIVTGAELALDGLSLGANYQTVKSQILANGRVLAGNRLMIHLSVPF